MATNKPARQKRILIEIEQQPALRINALAKRLAVSAETIRRDLDELTGQGLIERTYGGAVRRTTLEPSVSERHTLMVPEREALARAAVPTLKGARHIMIGSGATTVHVARRIAVEMSHLTVFTHAFGVATVLAANPTIRVVILPGDYHAGEGAMHGSATLRHIAMVSAEWTILGASGLDQTGPSDALLDAGDVYAAMLAASERRMIVADHTKFARTFPARFATWDDIDILASDKTPGPSLIAAVTRGGTELIRS